MTLDERNALILAHRHIATRLGRRAAWVPLEAEDRTQEALLALIRAVATWDPAKGKVTTRALFKVDAHLRDLLRRALMPKRKAPLEAVDVYAEEIEPEARDSDEAARWELRHDLESALARLSPRQATLLREYFGLDGTPGASLDELGARYGIGGSAVSQHLRRGLARLREIMRS